MNLSVELVNNILQYLSAKPFMEVAGLINAIQSEAQAHAAKQLEDQSADSKE